jgi:hypothetical protein
MITRRELMQRSLTMIASRRYSCRDVKRKLTLDFLGAIGVGRIISITTRDRWANTLPDAIATLEKFKRELPGRLVTLAAKRRTAVRIAEMDQFINALKAETQNGKVL